VSLSLVWNSYIFIHINKDEGSGDSAMRQFFFSFSFSFSFLGRANLVTACHASTWSGLRPNSESNRDQVLFLTDQLIEAT
jgi:hypothetical protein